jgi:hypothetical protein
MAASRTTWKLSRGRLLLRHCAAPAAAALIILDTSERSSASGAGSSRLNVAASRWS